MKKKPWEWQAPVARELVAWAETLPLNKLRKAVHICDVALRVERRWRQYVFKCLTLWRWS